MKTTRLVLAVMTLFAPNTNAGTQERLEACRQQIADLGALRLRTVDTKNRSCRDFPYQDAEGKYDSSAVLDLMRAPARKRWRWLEETRRRRPGANGHHLDGSSPEFEF